MLAAHVFRPAVIRHPLVNDFGVKAVEMAQRLRALLAMPADSMTADLFLGFAARISSLLFVAHGVLAALAHLIRHGPPAPFFAY